MLKKFTVKNYKNFEKEVCLDFEKTAGYQFSTDCITDGLISKMLIYGKNATGKTNLGSAVMDIRAMLSDAIPGAETEAFLNADSEEDAATFSYIFDFDGQEMVYRYAKFSEYRLKWEKLEINATLIFECNFSERKLVFPHLEAVEAETANVERYVRVLEAGEGEQLLLPFLRWLISNMALPDDSLLVKLLNYVRSMTMVTTGNALMRVRFAASTFFKRLEQENKLEELEDFFNAMGINCRLVLKKLPDGQIELYFSHKKLVPFLKNASSGTLALLDIYRKIVVAIEKASFVYLDEFDAFYHFELSRNIIRFISQNIKAQAIFTTHNTYLASNDLLRPDCYYVLKNGQLESFADSTQREIREGHNLEKMLRNGEFDD